MIFNRLTLCDFRAYAGVHHLDLAPRTDSGAVRPIILVGGLNGTGKTSLLMAVKLALYGRHAVGMGTTKAGYAQFIRECIHSGPRASVKATKAFVELDFTFGKLGQRHRYIVRRSWRDAGREVRETLTVDRGDGGSVSLSAGERQGFLNDIMPLGVSDLFFFDGERIAELAEDDTGRTLGAAVRRLHGLDLVERLRGDLRMYLLRSEAKIAERDVGEQVDSLRQLYEERKAELAERQEGLANAKAELDALIADRDQLEFRLAERGGGWARSRQERRTEASTLAEAVRRDERDLREEISGIYPLTLAADVLADALAAFREDLASTRIREANGVLRQFALTLKARLRDDTHIHIDSALAEQLRPEPHVTGNSDLTQRALGRMEQALDQEVPKAKVRVRRMVQGLSRGESELEQVTREMERAPDEASLAKEFSELATLNEDIVAASADVALRERELKIGYANAVRLARVLRDKHNALSEQQEFGRPRQLAAGARLLLRDFHQIDAERKMSTLEQAFADAFRRLARKGEMIAGARIDARRFTVTLLNGDGDQIMKSQLSAGEKQIYAIAMLEALARTSGRNLPVIIDTPLGRLDSRHRRSLVDHYFPHASHQVVLLSTDTEVDSSFFRSLSPQVSHAYEIRYNERQRSACLQRGYFWNERPEMAT